MTVDTLEHSIRFFYEYGFLMPGAVFYRMPYLRSQNGHKLLYNTVPFYTFRKIKLIVLAGFLWLVPSDFIDNFTVINIHPALLPAYGGKGMYGSFVHQAVLKNNETESGITIHLVNSEFDKGKPIVQVKCAVQSHDTVESLANRIHQLEYEYFPKSIEDFINKNFK